MRLRSDSTPRARPAAPEADPRRQLRTWVQRVSRALAALVLAAQAAGAQTRESPVVTTVAAVRAQPARFHLRWVVVTGTVIEASPRRLLTAGPDAVEMSVDGPVPAGPVEVVGQLIDIARLRGRERDTTLPGETMSLAQIYGRRWPARGAAVVVAAARVTRVTPPTARDSSRPLDVDFSAPTQGEVDVHVETQIRLQFSGPLNAASLEDRITVHYSAQESIERGEPTPPRIAFTVTYSAERHTVTIHPVQPLERFREVIVDVRPGIRGADGSLGRAWTLRFVTGGG